MPYSVNIILIIMLFMLYFIEHAITNEMNRNPIIPFIQLSHTWNYPLKYVE